MPRGRVGVVEKLINPEARPQLDAENRELQKQLVASYEQRQEVKLVPYAEALARRFPDRLGRRSIFRRRRSPARACSTTVRSTKLREYIDWSPFFLTWELKGKYPRIFDDPQLGEAAQQAVRRRASNCSTESSTRSCSPPAACTASGRRPATATTSSCTPTNRARKELCRFHTLRQQWERKGQDDVLRRWPISSPRSTAAATITSARSPSRPASAATSWPRSSTREHDDYNSIMTKALADRLAEAFAEYLHAAGPPRLGLWPRRAAHERRADRRKIPRHPPGARLSGAARPHREADAVRPARRRSERPASSSPRASPCTRRPASAACTSPIPQARYFAVDRITRDQVEDYARRKGMSVAEIERWLAPNLGYEPSVVCTPVRLRDFRSHIALRAAIARNASSVG